jgi:hypothetical protein
MAFGVKSREEASWLVQSFHPPKKLQRGKEKLEILGDGNRIDVMVSSLKKNELETTEEV